MTIRKLLIADDHKVIMIGTIEMLKCISPNLEIAMAFDFPQVLQKLKSEPFDLLVLDIRIPGGDNPTMIASVRKIKKDIKILVFSGLDESMYAYPYLQAGADGFLSKNATEEELRLAIEKITSGQKYLSNRMLQESINKLLNEHPGAENKLHLLSNRETQIVNLMMQGASTASIGHKLNLHTSTVSTHKMKIFGKLEVSNLVELIEYVKAFQRIDH